MTKAEPTIDGSTLIIVSDVFDHEFFMVTIESEDYLVTGDTGDRCTCPSCRSAIDRLVHHAVVLEFDVPSYRTDRSRRTSPPPATPRGRAPGPLLPRTRRVAAS